MNQRTTKPKKWHVRPAKLQISLGICPVWSECSLCAWKKFWSWASHWAHSEDSDQTGRMPWLIWVFAQRICHFVGFVMRWVILLCLPSRKGSAMKVGPFLRVFAVRMKIAWGLSYPFCAHWRLWSDWADAQADLSLRSAHKHFFGFIMRWLRLLYLPSRKGSTQFQFSFQIFNAARQMSHIEAAPDKSGLVLLDYWVGLKRCLVIIHN